MMRAGTVALVAIMVGACATTIRGTTNQVHFASDPAGATMTTTLGHNCVTPCTIPIERNKEFVATFTLAGYQPATVEVKPQWSREGGTSVAGNILLGGLIGLGVDAATGAGMDHHPNPVIGRLAAIVPPTPAPARRQQRERRPATPIAILLQRPQLGAQVAIR